MKIERDAVLELLFEAVRELNGLRDGSQQLPRVASAALASELDSLGFVNLVAVVEEMCESRFSKTVVLNDVALAPHQRDPFETIGSLADYVVLALGDQAAAWR
jgi:acyl carrier protein